VFKAEEDQEDEPPTPVFKAEEDQEDDLPPRCSRARRTRPIRG
jgi:hypothetical protein